MAYSFGAPKIVTNGLVLYLDAANRRSYPGSGTAWNDLSGNGNHGTLTNGPTFNGDNAGSVAFDGVNDYAECGDIDITSSFTLSVWFKGNTTGHGSYCGILNKGNSSNFGNYGFFGDASSNYVRFGFMDTTNNQREISNSNYSDITANVWVNYVGTYDFSNLRLYRNTVQISVNGANTTPKTDNVKTSVGARANTVYAFSGLVGISQIYNRALSAEEVLQNYNATKARYNL